MSIDKNNFFREATLRICGSLEIETALWSCFLFIKNYIPADQIYLNFYDSKSGKIKALATANEKEGWLSDIEFQADKEMRSVFENPQHPNVFVINEPQTDLLGKYGVEIIKKEIFSALVMRLMVGDNFVGAFAVITKGLNQYHDEHVRLFNMLCHPVSIALSNSLQYLEVLRLKDLLTDDKLYLQDELRQISGHEIIGADFGLKGVMEMVRQVAPLSSPVLLLGETGVGKQVIAKTIYNFSNRKNGPFIKVNCGAIPETLLDSELFGHEKGAFTGALSQKRGRFERAHGGTIFLDEVGELPAEAQVRLLNVLQEKEIERVGGSKTIKVDIRVIAATHQNLDKMIAEKRFREDLYFRLKVFPIVIPPLRERKVDIPALVMHLIRKKSLEMGFTRPFEIEKGAMDQLMNYPWPGNVRELENTVERSLILSKEGILTFNNFDKTPTLKKEVFATNRHPEDAQTLDAAMTAHICAVLEKTNGKVEGKKGAAALLGIKPGTLRFRMKKLGIPFGRKVK